MLSEAVLARAVATLGVRENPPGSNDSPEIRVWLANVGIHRPASWCAAWLFSMFELGAADVGLANPFPRTAGALDVWSRADQAYRSKEPAVGCAAVFRHLVDGRPDGRGHVELVRELLGGGRYRFIGGNTSGEGERQGNAVASGVFEYSSRRRGSLELVDFLVFEQDLAP